MKICNLIVSNLIICPFKNLTSTSKNVIFSLLDLCVNLREGWKFLKSARNCSKLSPNKKYVIYISKPHMNTHAYGGANLAPIAVSQICCLVSPLNSKLVQI